MTKPCLTCGLLTRSTTARCGPCERNHQRARNQARTHLYGGGWRTKSRQARKTQPWCSICGRTALVAQLTLDHEHGQVECRECNSSHRKNAT